MFYYDKSTKHLQNMNSGSRRIDHIARGMAVATRDDYRTSGMQNNCNEMCQHFNQVDCGRRQVLTLNWRQSNTTATARYCFFTKCPPYLPSL